MPKAKPIQAFNELGHVVASFPSIAAAGASGYCHSSINASLNHGRVIEGLTWRRANKSPPISIDRLEAVAARLEALAERFSK